VAWAVGVAQLDLGPATSTRPRVGACTPLRIFTACLPERSSPARELDMRAQLNEQSLSAWVGPNAFAHVLHADRMSGSSASRRSMQPRRIRPTSRFGSHRDIDFGIRLRSVGGLPVRGRPRTTLAHVDLVNCGLQGDRKGVRVAKRIRRQDPTAPGHPSHIAKHLQANRLSG